MQEHPGCRWGTFVVLCSTMVLIKLVGVLKYILPPSCIESMTSCFCVGVYPGPSPVGDLLATCFQGSNLLFLLLKLLCLPGDGVSPARADCVWRNYRNWSRSWSDAIPVSVWLNDSWGWSCAASTGLSMVRLSLYETIAPGQRAGD